MPGCVGTNGIVVSGRLAHGVGGQQVEQQLVGENKAGSFVKIRRQLQVLVAFQVIMRKQVFTVGNG